MAYQTGKIYRIICLSKSDIQYVGSTFDVLRYRWVSHKRHYKEWLKKGETRGCSIYKYFKERGIKDFKIVLIKEYKVCAENNKDRKHLNIYEQLWKNKINCVNKNNPFTIPFLQKERQKERHKEYRERKKEYREEHKEEIALRQKEYYKEYYEEKKEEILTKMKEYREEHKEEIAKKQKEYYEKKKEEILTKVNIYYEKNKEKIAMRRKKKISCSLCGSIVTTSHIRLHQRSQKCKTQSCLKEK